MTGHVVDLHGLRDRQHTTGTTRFSGTSRGLVIAAALIGQNDLPDCNVNVWDEGRIVVLDYTSKVHAAGDCRVACQKLGLAVEEFAADTADGCAAIELRGSDYQDGVLRTVRAVIPVPATWTLS